MEEIYGLAAASRFTHKVSLVPSGTNGQQSELSTTEEIDLELSETQ